MKMMSGDDSNNESDSYKQGWEIKKMIVAMIKIMKTINAAMLNAMKITITMIIKIRKKISTDNDESDSTDGE